MSSNQSVREAASIVYLTEQGRGSLPTIWQKLTGRKRTHEGYRKAVRQLAEFLPTLARSEPESSRERS